MENLQNPKEAVLKLKRVYFSDISYKFEAKEKTNFKYTFSFQKEMREISQNEYYICLVCNAEDKKNKVELHIKIVGEFECELDDEKFKEILLNQNAISILFPYLRSQIYMVTAQPSTPPVNLPAINILSLFEK